MSEKRKLLVLLALEMHKALLLAKYIYLKKIKKRTAVKRLLKQRRSVGYYHTLVPFMRLNDVESFINFHRMDLKTFDDLLKILGHGLQAIPIRIQEHVTPAERLSLTLRYLASGDSVKSVGYYGFRIGASATSKIIRTTTDLIWKKLQFVFPKPTTDMWENVASNFYKRWGFPNCLGAIDGKHVVIQALSNHNSLTFNYKHTHSIVLMAIADADYKFLLVDIGALGHNSDGGIFRNCKFGKAIFENSPDMHFPSPKNLPGSTTHLPYVFLGDEAFPLRKNLLRPFPGRSTGNIPLQQDIFNKHLSRARRVVENSFGILSNNFRIFRKPIFASKHTLINVVKSTICLHNFLRERACPNYMPADLIDRESEDGVVRPGTWRQQSTEGLLSIGRVCSNHSSADAVAVRNAYKDYFNNIQ